MKHLNALLILIVFLTPGFLLSMTQKIELGQSSEQIIKILGKPIGTLELQSKTILLYPQGKVILRENKVSDIDLMSAAEFAAVQERKRLEREEWLIRQEKLSAIRLEKGRNLKAFKLQSSAFAALPAKKRVDYWRSFQTRYPKVDVSEQIAKALENYQSELTEQKNQKRIADLEARVAQAEKAAAAAQHESESLRNRISTRNYAHYGRQTYYTKPYKVRYPQRKVIVYSNKDKIVQRPYYSRTHYPKYRKYTCSYR